MLTLPGIGYKYLFICILVVVFAQVYFSNDSCGSNLIVSFFRGAVHYCCLIFPASQTFFVIRRETRVDLDHRLTATMSASNKKVVYVFLSLLFSILLLPLLLLSLLLLSLLLLSLSCSFSLILSIALLLSFYFGTSCCPACTRSPLALFFFSFCFVDFVFCILCAGYRFVGAFETRRKIINFYFYAHAPNVSLLL